MQNNNSTSKNTEKKQQYYKVEVNALIPGTITYRVFAETPEEAVDRVQKGYEKPVEMPKLRINNSVKKDVKVYKWGTSVIEFLKRL